jgi:RHS repeat-associated protein
MVSTLSYSGSSASLSNQRAFDAWGNIRNSDTSGDPKGRYCASLGHRADDESGLTYMRARYYDPGCGRLTSEDPSMDGRNWLTYAGNAPTSLADASGKSPESVWEGLTELWAPAGLMGIFIPLMEHLYKVDKFVYLHPGADSDKALVTNLGMVLISVCGAIVATAMFAAVATAGFATGLLLVILGATIMLACEVEVANLGDSFTESSTEDGAPNG